MLASMNIENAVITADAMHCQTETTQLVRRDPNLCWWRSHKFSNNQTQAAEFNRSTPIKR